LAADRNKVINPRPGNNNPLITPDESNPDELVSCEATNSELVRSELTNSVEREDQIFCELVNSVVTYYYLIQKYKVINPRLVSRLLTILSTESERRIVETINRLKVFIIPEIIATQKTNKQHTYELLRELKSLGVIKNSHIPLDSPIPDQRGPKPKIHHLSSIELNGAMDPLVNELRKRHFRTFKRYDDVPQEDSTGVNIGEISKDIAYQLISEGIKIASVERVKEFSKQYDVPPSQRSDVAREVFAILRKHREGPHV